MPADCHAAEAARSGDALFLARALADTRAQTLQTARDYASALPGLRVPRRPELNPPVWEIGHVGWFQERWIARNPQRAAGVAADPDAPLLAPGLPGADALYDSSAVAHARRWDLPLPDLETTLRHLEQGQRETLAHLRDAGDGDAPLYFFRLCLFHEDMHNEAAIYMANHLGFAVRAAREPRAARAGILRLRAGTVRLGRAGGGFAFDNELPARAMTVPACEIDTAPVTNARYRAFVEAGGYATPALWSEAGRAWLAAGGARHPRFWRRAGAHWEQRWFGVWRPLADEQPVMNLNCFEAEAWCAWAGRRLPSEAEWECAATTQPGFDWGEVWEWTASGFAPYPGFRPHPYRDYSAPWFGTRRVLRGASVATHPRMTHPRYRNFFTPERNDIFAGFRTCAP